MAKRILVRCSCPSVCHCPENTVQFAYEQGRLSHINFAQWRCHAQWPFPEPPEIGALLTGCRHDCPRLPIQGLDDAGPTADVGRSGSFLNKADG